MINDVPHEKISLLFIAYSKSIFDFSKNHMFHIILFLIKAKGSRVNAVEGIICWPCLFLEKNITVLIQNASIKKNIFSSSIDKTFIQSNLEYEKLFFLKQYLKFNLKKKNPHLLYYTEHQKLTKMNKGNSSLLHTSKDWMQFVRVANGTNWRNGVSVLLLTIDSN